MRYLLAAALFSISLPAFAGEDCTCKYRDTDVREGETICMQTPNGSQMAQCSRVLNNTSWKFLGTTCPLSSLEDDKKQSTVDLESVQKQLKQG